MNVAQPNTSMSSRREFPRLKVRCRARIRIGKREYAGFVENISDAGARVTTITPIRDSGPVSLILPDLPPVSGHIRWMEAHGGGVCFNFRMTDSILEDWARSRLQIPQIAVASSSRDTD